MKSDKKTLKSSLEDFIIEWNIRFRYDRLWRKKYNVPFGSEQHLQISQVDIYLDLLEDRVIERAQGRYQQRQKDLAEYKATGKFLKETVLSQAEEDKLFKKIKFNK